MRCQQKAVYKGQILINKSPNYCCHTYIYLLFDVGGETTRSQVEYQTWLDRYELAVK